MARRRPRRAGQRAMEVLAISVLAACGGFENDPLDVAAYRDLLERVERGAEDHTEKLARSDRGACAVEAKRYAGEVTIAVERICSSSREMDACSVAMAHGPSESVAACESMRRELSAHLVSACDGDIPGEARRHREALVGIVKQEEGVAEDMQRMMRDRTAGADRCVHSPP